jgi:hypothetical protein
VNLIGAISSCRSPKAILWETFCNIWPVFRQNFLVMFFLLTGLCPSNERR